MEDDEYHDQLKVRYEASFASTTDAPKDENDRLEWDIIKMKLVRVMRVLRIVCQRCLRDSCMKSPSFNFEGSKVPVYCKQHAEDGRVNVHNTRCSQDSCMMSPSFNVRGSKSPAYCKNHAKDGMVSVKKTQAFFIRRTPAWHERAF